MKSSSPIIHTWRAGESVDEHAYSPSFRRSAGWRSAKSNRSRWTLTGGSPYRRWMRYQLRQSAHSHPDYARSRSATPRSSRQRARDCKSRSRWLTSSPAQVGPSSSDASAFRNCLSSAANDNRRSSARIACLARAARSRSRVCGLASTTVSLGSNAGNDTVPAWSTQCCATSDSTVPHKSAVSASCVNAVSSAAAPFKSPV